MANRVINGDGDIIENEQEDSHVKGVCVPDWVEPQIERIHTEQFTEQYT